MGKSDDNDNRQWLNIPSRNNTQLSSGGQTPDASINSHGQPEKSPQTTPAGQPGHAENHDTSHNPQGAAHVARSKIDKVYETNPPHQEDESEQMTSGVHGTYNRGHDQTANYDWKAYHTAWQDYYQKYYERYYVQQLHAHRQQIQNQASATGNNSQATQTEPEAKHRPSEEFRSEILNKVSERAKKVRGSTHFLPIASAVVIGVLFLLFNYNKLLAAEMHSYISPSTRVSDNVIVDPNANVPVSDDPRVIVPKINVDAPLVFGLDSLDNATTQKALEDGVVHYPIPGASSLPGQTGNSVFLGHSSHTVFDQGNYKFVFVLLPRMEKGDLYYIHYEGKRYVYRVTRKQVITPDQVGELVIDTNKPMSTLVTCVPIGTNAKRLLVFGEQISPDPSKAEQVETQKNTDKNVTIPGNSPTFLESVFGG